MLSIIIPAHNEEKRIARTLENYAGFFRDRVKVGGGSKAKEIEKPDKGLDKFEIIVVANACKDNTVGVVRNLMKKFREIKLLDFKRGGKGFAVKEGFKEALQSNAEIIGFVDADMATPPQAFYDLVKNLGNYDGVIASRYVKGAILKPEPSFSRKLTSRVFNFLVRSLFLFNFRDSQCGAKLFRRRVIEAVLPGLEMTQWAFDIDLLYNTRKLGFRVKEQPTFWKDVDYSKINLKKSSIQMFLAIMQLRMLNSGIKRGWKFFRPFAGGLYKLVK